MECEYKFKTSPTNEAPTRVGFHNNWPIWALICPLLLFLYTLLISSHIILFIHSFINHKHTPHHFQDQFPSDFSLNPSVNTEHHHSTPQMGCGHHPKFIHHLLLLILLTIIFLLTSFAQGYVSLQIIFLFSHSKTILSDIIISLSFFQVECL